MIAEPVGGPQLADEPTIKRWVLPRWTSSAFALTIYSVAAAGVFWSAWRSPSVRAVGVGTDPLLFIWFIRWIPFAVTHGLNPLLTSYLDFPAGANLTWTGLVPLPALLMSPMTLVLGPVISYNVLVSLGLALSAWTGFLAIRRFVIAQPAAFAGGLLYGFSPALMGQSLGHPHIAIAVTPPLMVLALDRILVRQPPPLVVSGALLGVLAAAQLYTGEEMLAMEALAAAAAIVLLAASQKRALLMERAGYALGAIAVAAPVCALLGAPLLAVQFFGPQHVPGGTLEPLNVYVSDLVNFVLPTSQQAFAVPMAIRLTSSATGNAAEWGGYIGVPLLALLIFSAIRYRQWLLVRLSATMAILLSLLSMGVLIHVAGLTTHVPVLIAAFGLIGLRRWFPLPALVGIFVAGWACLIAVPILHNLLPARLMVLVFLFCGFLLAVLLDDVIRHWKGRQKTLALAAVGVSLLLLLPKLPFSSLDTATPAFFAINSREMVPTGSVALVAPYSRKGSAVAMLWQAQSGFAFKMPEGYIVIPEAPGIGTSPVHTLLGDEMARIEDNGPPDAIDPGSMATMRRELAGWQVTTVIVGPMAHRDAMVGFMTRLLGSAPATIDGVQMWRGATPAN